MRTFLLNRIFITAFLFLAVSMISIGVSETSAQDTSTGVVGDAATIACDTDLGTSEAPEGATSFIVDSEQSTARYKVEEELAGTGLTEAVGETNAVIGTILVAEDGTPLPCSRFDVDLRTLQTDEAKRDARVQETLGTDTYPLATFIVSEVEVPEGGLAEGEEIELTLTGNLEMHGVTREVSWTATVTRDGESMSGTATTQLSFDDFQVEKPVMGPVMSIDDTLTLEIDIVANIA